MNKKISTEKFWRAMLLVLLVICVIPLLWIAVYNHSSADDYSYGCLTRWVWTDTHNIFQVIAAVGTKIRDTYYGWQGSYSAVALFALQPAVFGEQFYKCTTYLVLGLFLAGLFLFFRKSVTMIGGEKKTADVVAIVVALLCIELLPSPVEGFFWWNGSVYYVVFYALFLIQTVVLLDIVKSDACSWWKLVWTGIFGVIIAGGNYITSLLMMEIGFLIFLQTVLSKKKVMWKVLLIYLVTVAGFLFNCLAPGNAVRQTSFESWSPIRAILYSYHEAYQYMIQWTTPLVLLALVFLIPFLWKIPMIGRLEQRAAGSSLLALGIQYSLFASTFAPTLYAYGDVGAGRIQNIRFFFWIIICVGMEFTVINLIKQMLAGALGQNGPIKLYEITRTLYEKYAMLFFGCVFFLGAFFIGNTLLADDTRDLVSITAVKSVISGEAQEYDAQMKERQAAYKSDAAELGLTPLSAKPELLFWEDITEDEDAWVNGVVAKFYRKDKVYLKSIIAE